MTNLLNKYPRLAAFFHKPKMLADGNEFALMMDEDDKLLPVSRIVIGTDGSLYAEPERANYYLINKETGKIEMSATNIVSAEMAFSQAEAFRARDQVPGEEVKSSDTLPPKTQH